MSPGWRVVLEEQKAYYRNRAAEYDAWFYHIGRYDSGPALNAQWSREAHEAHSALLRLGPVDTALELACGTGIWTEDLVRVANQIVALDSSSEMLSLNQAKLDTDNITYHQVDLFDWQPTDSFDLVLIAFFLSHVPVARRADFLAQVRRAVRPGGRLFVVDTRLNAAVDAWDFPQEIIDGTSVQTRRTDDGDEFRVVKVFFERTELEQVLRNAGFESMVAETNHYFIYAIGQG